MEGNRILAGKWKRKNESPNSIPPFIQGGKGVCQEFGIKKHPGMERLLQVRRQARRHSFYPLGCIQKEEEKKVDMEYNKAVRDRIPEIIQKDGHSCNVKKLSDEEFLEHLERKISEEVAEYQSDKNPEELADILEVIYRVAQLKGVSKEELEKIRIKKSEERGGFDKNLFLIDTSKS